MSGMKGKPIDRFLRYVHISPLGGCWVWTGALVPDGYGSFSRGAKSEGNINAHRWAYEHWVGAVPDGLVLDHLCRNRQCCFPGHLEPVTVKENQRRGHSPKHRQTHCKKGHPFVGRRFTGYRTCGVCHPGKVYPF